MSVTPVGIYRGMYLLQNMFASSASWRSHIGASNDAEALARTVTYESFLSDTLPPFIVIERNEGYTRRRISTGSFRGDGAYTVNLEVVLPVTSVNPIVYAAASIEDRRDEEKYFTNLAAAIASEVEVLSTAGAAVMSDNPFKIREMRISAEPMRVPFCEAYNLKAPTDGSYVNAPVWHMAWEVT